MGNGFEKRIENGRRGRFRLCQEPLTGIVHIEPVGIGFLEVADHQPVDRLIGTGIGSNDRQPALSDFLELIKTGDESKEIRLGKPDDALESMFEGRKEWVDSSCRIPQHLLEIEQQIVAGVRLDLFQPGVLDGVYKHVDEQHGCFGSPWMFLQNVEIVECVPPGLLNDILPVAPGMGQFLQKNRQSFDNPVIGTHDVEQQPIALVDGDFDPITGEVDFEGFGLKGHETHPVDGLFFKVFP